MKIRYTDIRVAGRLVQLYGYGDDWIGVYGSGVYGSDETIVIPEHPYVDHINVEDEIRCALESNHAHEIDEIYRNSVRIMAIARGWPVRRFLVNDERTEKHRITIARLPAPLSDITVYYCNDRWIATKDKYIHACYRYPFSHRESDDYHLAQATKILDRYIVDIAKSVPTAVEADDNFHEAIRVLANKVWYSITWPERCVPFVCLLPDMRLCNHVKDEERKDDGKSY